MDPFDGRSAVFFDFDGVLVDSVDVKTRAFAALYAEDHPEIVDAVVAHHLAHGGVTRRKKFEHFERALLNRQPSRARIEALAERFAALVVEEVVRAPEIEGASALLGWLEQRGTPCFVVSGTPEDELQAIVARRGWTHFFRAVRGAPADKAALLVDLTCAHDYAPPRCLMVGDSTTDSQAAAATGMPFLGVVRAGAASPFGAAPTLCSFQSWNAPTAARAP
jgi:phosphoglycolate phosphatase-like HAD superfamily hydrolase